MTRRRISHNGGKPSCTPRSPRRTPANNTKRNRTIADNEFLRIYNNERKLKHAVLLKFF
jgi:hypothetical protein